MTAWTFSQTDRIMRCEASAALPQAHSLESSEHADWGTGVHQYLRDCVVLGVEAARAALPKRAPWRACCLALDPSAIWRECQGVQAEWTVAYNIATGEARSLGTDLGRNYPDLGTDWLVGTIDLFAGGQESSRVYDYKTGHTAPRAEESGQLMLAALAVAALLKCDSVTVGIVHVSEDGSYTVDEHTYEAWDLDAAREQVRAVWRKVQAAKALVMAGQTPNVTTGAHCKWCPAIHACPAQTYLARRLVAEKLMPPERFATLDASNAGRAWEQLQRARRLLDEIERALKARIDHDSFLPLPDGSEVRAVQVTRESIDADLASTVLADVLGIEHAHAATERRMTKAGVEAAARAAGKDPKAVLGALRSVGAMPARETTSYVTRKPKVNA